MIVQGEVYCYHCKKTFVLNGFRLMGAKTVSCLYCGKRINRKKSAEIVQIANKGGEDDL